MSSANGRGGRRRRILNEGRLANDQTAQTDGENEGAAGQAPRFAPAADSVSFGIARRLLPISGATLSCVAVGGVALTAGLVALDRTQTSIAQAAGLELSSALLAPLNMASGSSLAAWFTSSMALVIAGLSAILFGLRRHRSDDLGGVYRWWMPAALLSVIASMSFATGLHHMVAAAIGNAVGWSPLSGHTFWWLMPAAVVSGPLAVLIVRDMRESKLALSSAGLGLAAVVVALSAHMGWAPSSMAAELPVISAAALLIGLILMVVAQLSYARRMVLEADGKIEKPLKRLPAAKEEKNPQKQKGKSEAEQPSTVSETVEPEPKKKGRKQRKAAAESTQWVDGSQDGFEESYDDEEQPRKLTKAERKRLRRLKERQNRAA